MDQPAVTFWACDHPISQNTGGPCDVVTSLHLQILFAYTGSFVSPQAVVVGAQVTYSTTDVFSLVSEYVHGAHL